METIELQEIAVPVGTLNEKLFEAPDLESAFEFYPTFIQHSKKKISPTKYLYEVLEKIIHSVEKQTKVMNEFTIMLGWTFHQKIEEYTLMYQTFRQKERFLTITDFNTIPYGQIFAKGWILAGRTGIQVFKPTDWVLWIAKKGQGYDWAIYVDSNIHDEEYVKKHGAKIVDRSFIQELVPCDKEMLERYRK